MSELPTYQHLACPTERCSGFVVEEGALPRERLVAYVEHAQVVHGLSVKDAWAFGVMAEPAGAQQVYEEAEKNRG